MTRCFLLTILFLHESHSLYKFPMSKEHSELLNHLRLPEEPTNTQLFFVGTLSINLKGCLSATNVQEELCVNYLPGISHPGLQKFIGPN